MINKIKQVIENNPSSNMQKYGYTIQVDSSIKEMTNQFTYTENKIDYTKHTYSEQYFSEIFAYFYQYLTIRLLCCKYADFRRVSAHRIRLMCN